MTDDGQNGSADFRSQVQALLAAGKLSAEDAQGLLEGLEEPGDTVPEGYVSVNTAADSDAGAGHDLRLDIQGFISCGSYSSGTLLVYF